MWESERANKMPRASEARDPWFPIRGPSPPARAGTLAVAARLPGRSCDLPLVIAPLQFTRTNVPEMRMECNELRARDGAILWHESQRAGRLSSQLTENRSRCFTPGPRHHGLHLRSDPRILSVIHEHHAPRS